VVRDRNTRPFKMKTGLPVTCPALPGTLARSSSHGAGWPSSPRHPAGVALGLPDHPYLRAGDEVRLEIDGPGWAQQRFIPAP
jgi:hypothetical protein